MGCCNAYGQSFSPTLDIDIVWHAHQLSPNNYYNKCIMDKGFLINHIDLPEADTNARGTNSTIDAWYLTYGENLEKETNKYWMFLSNKHYVGGLMGFELCGSDFVTTNTCNCKNKLCHRVNYANRTGDDISVQNKMLRIVNDSQDKETEIECSRCCGTGLIDRMICCYCNGFKNVTVVNKTSKYVCL